MKKTAAWIRVLLGTACVAAGACGSEERREPAAVEPGAPASAPHPVPPAARAPEPGSEVAAPDGASLRVFVEDGRASIAARDSLALAVLELLAERAGFAIVARTDIARTVSIALDRVPLEQAIAAILAGTPYAIDYRYDAARGAHAIESVHVGPRGVNVAAPGARPAAGDVAEAPGAPPPRERPDAGGAYGDGAEEVDLARVLAERAAGDPETAPDPETLSALADPRDGLRAEALADLGTEGENLDTTIAFAKSDPSPLVRGAAIEALGSDGRYSALSAVVDALRDRDPSVVLKAIAVIENEGDATLLVRLAPLARHSDTAVRARVAAALEQLEDE